MLVPLKPCPGFVKFVELELQTVPSLNPGIAAFLGLQVFVSGSVYPKYPGPSASPSIK